MITMPTIDDNDDQIPHDYQVKIEGALRASGYKPKDGSVLININWLINRIQIRWGDYAKAMRSKRSESKATDTLIQFRSAVETLQTALTEIENNRTAARILFDEAAAKTGNHEILFELDSTISSPDLQAILRDLTSVKLRRKLPPASGPIPIGPLVPDLIPLLRALETGLAPLKYRNKWARSVPSHTARCAIAANLLQVLGIAYTTQTIRNATS
jgi:hypothetical protein